MKTIVIVLVISFVIVALAFAGIGVKMLFQKNGEFKRHCTNRDPYTGKSAGCACEVADTLCDNNKKHPYQPLDVNKTLMDEINGVV